MMNTPEPAPKRNSLPPVWPLVIWDMEGRNLEGINKYGTPLQPHNGRDALLDAYQEALDLAVYLRQAIWERDNPAPANHRERFYEEIRQDVKAPSAISPEQIHKRLLPRMEQ